MKNDSQNLIRQWRMLKLLADTKTGYTVKELSAEMSVSQDTILRDISDLGDSGFGVCETVGFWGLKRWRVEGFRESLGFRITDLLSVYIGNIKDMHLHLDLFGCRLVSRDIRGTQFWCVAYRELALFLRLLEFNGRLLRVDDYEVSRFADVSSSAVPGMHRGMRLLGRFWNTRRDAGAFEVCGTH